MEERWNTSNPGEPRCRYTRGWFLACNGICQHGRPATSTRHHRVFLSLSFPPVSTWKTGKYNHIRNSARAAFHHHLDKCRSKTAFVLVHRHDMTSMCLNSADIVVWSGAVTFWQEANNRGAAASTTCLTSGHLDQVRKYAAQPEVYSLTPAWTQLSRPRNRDESYVAKNPRFNLDRPLSHLSPRFSNGYMTDPSAAASSISTTALLNFPNGNADTCFHTA